MSFRMLNQHYILCNSPDTVRRVFLDRHDIYDKKSPQMRNALQPLLGDGLFVSDGELWKQRRQACAPPFENKYLPAFAGIMSSCAEQMAEQWSKHAQNEPLDVLNEMAKLTAQIIGRTVFGDDVPESDAAEVVQGFTEYQYTINQMDYADTFGLPFLKCFTSPLRKRRAKAAADKVHRVIDDIIARHDAQGMEDDLTLLSVLMKAEPGGCPMSQAAIRNEAIVMFMAGHETTANSLAWTWYLLDGCKASRDKMYAEIDTVLQGRTPTYEDVLKLPYTMAVFKEALRLYPPVPLLSRQARDSDKIRGNQVKPGTIMLALPWLLHRHEKEWHEPDAFMPERFMPGSEKPDKFLYIPFSVGRRVCLGLRFGLVEGVLCLAVLAQNYRLRLPDSHRVDIECHLTLRPAGGLPMLLEDRRKHDD